MGKGPHDPNARVFDHTGSQTMGSFTGGGSGGGEAPGMAALEVRKNMPVSELLLIQAHMPSDARLVSSAPHPKQDDLLVLFYQSADFPLSDEEGRVQAITYGFTDTGHMLVKCPWR